MGYAIANLVPQHLAEVKQRRLAQIDKVEREVRERLNREINYWDARAARLREEERAGKEQRVNAQNAEATAQRLADRLQKRQEELARERLINALPPVLKGAALVIPKGLLAPLIPTASPGKPPGFSDDPVARAEIEKLAMAAVMVVERALGNLPKDVSAEKRGYDIESRDGLDPAEGLLDPFADALADGIARVPRGSAVDRRRAAVRVLRHVRRRVHRPQFIDEVLGVIGLVGAGGLPYFIGGTTLA